MNSLELQGLGNTVLKAQPFSQFIGARTGAICNESVELLLDLRPEHLQQHGIVHGGVIAYLVDNALTFAGGLRLGFRAVTCELKLNYVRPANGVRLRSIAEVVHSTRTSAVTRCNVFSIDRDGRESLVAVGQGTILQLPAPPDFTERAAVHEEATPPLA